MARPVRAIEGGTGYWMGALSGEATGAWGVAWIDGWTSYVRLGIVTQAEEALTVAHELGHSMSLYHAPCGTRSVLDTAYPYANGTIGTWGIDSRSGFDMKAVAHREGSSGFAFTIPSRPEWAGALAGIELAGPGGSATVDDATNRPAVILRERETGRVRAILSDASAAMAAGETADAARGSLVPGTDLKILFSRGLPR